MKALAVGGGLLIGLASCTKDDGDTVKGRVSLLRTGGTTVQLIPAREQLPYCLAFTHALKGVTRQLTMTEKNVSFDCKAGKPIGGVAFRIPFEEGPVKIYVLFSSEPLNAASVAQQILEQSDPSHVSAMDLRLPGRAQLEVLDFTPEADTAPTTGQMLGAPTADGGAP